MYIIYHCKQFQNKIRLMLLMIICFLRKDSRLYSYLPVVGMTLKLYNLLPHPTEQYLHLIDGNVFLKRMLKQTSLRLFNIYGISKPFFLVQYPNGSVWGTSLDEEIKLSSNTDARQLLYSVPHSIPLSNLKGGRKVNENHPK